MLLGKQKIWPLPLTNNIEKLDADSSLGAQNEEQIHILLNVMKVLRVMTLVHRWVDPSFPGPFMMADTLITKNFPSIPGPYG